MLWTKRSRILPIETFIFLLPVFRCLSLVFVKRHWSSTYILPSSSTSFTFHMVYACMCAFRLKRIKLLRVSLIIAQYYIIPDYPSPNPPPPSPSSRPAQQWQRIIDFHYDQCDEIALNPSTNTQPSENPFMIAIETMSAWSLPAKLFFFIRFQVL